MHSYPEEPALGARVLARVDRIYSFGVFVELKDGRPAYIHRADLSLLGDRPPQTLLQVGQEVEAVVTRASSPGWQLELSIVLAQLLPWAEVERRFKSGDPCRAVVRQVRDDGYDVAVEGVARGFVAFEEAGEWPEIAPEALFWPDDHLEGIVLRLERGRQLVHLSVRRRVEQLLGVQAVQAALERQESTQPPAAQGVRAAGNAAAEAPSVRVICVAAAGMPADMAQLWLREAGARAIAARSLADLLQLQRARPVRRVLLHEELASHWTSAEWNVLGREWPHLLLALFSHAGGRVQPDLEAAPRIDAVFCLPDDLDALRDWLHSPPAALPSSPAPPVEARTAPTEEEESTVAVGLARLIDKVRRSTRADAAALFRLQPNAQQIEVLVERELGQLGAAALTAVRDSPVRDVIESGQRLFEDDAEAHGYQRARRLREAFATGSYLGVPVQVEGRVEHALFLLSRRRAAFGPGMIEQAEAAADHCAALLERARMDEMLLAQTTLLQWGQLIAMVGHELRGRINPVGNLVKACSLQIDRMDARNLETQRPALQNAAALLTRTVNEARELVAFLSDAHIQAERERFDCIALLELCLRQVERLHKPNSLKWELHRHCDAILIDGYRGRLQMVFFNLILNAAQQMVPRPGLSTVTVSTAEEESEGQHWLLIRFTDSGPGIHTRLWRQIFEPGFSTRKGGSGLGLYICRQQVKAHAGAIRVEQSRILTGTTLVVRLPLHSSR